MPNLHSFLTELGIPGRLITVERTFYPCPFHWESKPSLQIKWDFCPSFRCHFCGLTYYAEDLLMKIYGDEQKAVRRARQLGFVRNEEEAQQAIAWRNQTASLWNWGRRRILLAREKPFKADLFGDMLLFSDFDLPKIIPGTDSLSKYTQDFLGRLIYNAWGERVKLELFAQSRTSSVRLVKRIIQEPGLLFSFHPYVTRMPLTEVVISDDEDLCERVQNDMAEWPPERRLPILHLYRWRRRLRSKTPFRRIHFVAERRASLIGSTVFNRSILQLHTYPLNPFNLEAPAETHPRNYF